MSEQERKGTFYPFATIGARTERGGRVTSGSGANVCGLAIACVGDIVTYSDASEAVIVDGAGAASVIEDRPAALVGSTLSNGDRIIETIWAELESGVFVSEGEGIPGLFDAGWTPPPREPAHRFAVRGATTARGGVLLEVTSNLEVHSTYRRAGRIGDWVQYQDGTLARIITGIGLPGDTAQAFAVVGSLLDNGDVITDSPHRKASTVTAYVPIDERGVALTRQ
jgi:uncharacterized Zn-binding protein involved in type VI secretion